MSQSADLLKPKKRDFARRRDEILRVSARIFSRLGFRHATLDDIARELNITRPALYYYADSKDKLLGECASIAFDQLQNAVKAAQNASSGLEQLRYFFRRYAEIVCDDFGRCFVLTDLSEMGDAERENARKAQIDLARVVTAMVKKGVRDGSIRRSEPVDVSLALFALFNGIPRWYKSEGRKPAQIADDFLDLVVDGLRPRGGR
jgi:TetR/AcrR family transcriptional regulator, cholesterol catabolism regulator